MSLLFPITYFTTSNEIWEFWIGYVSYCDVFYSSIIVVLGWMWDFII